MIAATLSLASIEVGCNSTPRPGKEAWPVGQLYTWAAYASPHWTAAWKATCTKPSPDDGATSVPSGRDRTSNRIVAIG